MRNKLAKARPLSDQKPAFSIHQVYERNPSPVIAVPKETSTPAASKTLSALNVHSEPRPTLTPASEGTINAAMSQTTTSSVNGKVVSPAPASLSPRLPNRMNSTIRAVASFEDRSRCSDEDSNTDGTPLHSASRDSGFSSSLNSNTSMSSSLSQQRAPATLNGLTKMPSVGRLKPTIPTTTQDGSDGLLDMAPRTSLTTRPSFPVDVPQRDSSLSSSATAASSLSPISSTHADPPPGGGHHSPDPSLSATEARFSSAGWDNSVGKAGLGKTGRVINRLVSDNEALKRDIQIERLRAEESRQAARLLEDKLERVVSDYESRLLEASVTKTLLARKERQVESLQDAVELERRRAADARERERTWKDEMERARADAGCRVDEASAYAALCEGRYTAISSHWREQGDEVRRAMGRMRGEVDGLAAERRRDDERIETLRELCDQQDGNIRELRRQKDEIEAQFERYKAQQEEALREIKRKADEREREQERVLQEAREVLDKLKWALNVKGTISWAE